MCNKMAGLKIKGRPVMEKDYTDLAQDILNHAGGCDKLAVLSTV